MPGFLLHLGATVMCAHGGQATPTTPNPRLLVSGQPTVLISTPYVVAGCAMPPPAAGNGPDVTAQFITSAVRLTSNAQPLLLSDSQSIAMSTGMPLIITVTQVRVKGM